MVNVPMRRILGLPFATPLGRHLMLLHLTGRRTGRTYHQPVSYIRHEDALLTPGGGRWTLNLSDNQPVPIRLLGRDITARPELIHDPNEVEALLDVMVEANPTVKRFVRVPRAQDGRLDRTALATAIAHGFRIVRWHLDPADLPTTS
jgi:F420H(2)-dependent quinone reductase